MNHITIYGRLGRDAESKTLDNGCRVTNLNLAETIRKKGQEDETVWWQVSLWQENFHNLAKYLTKGCALIVIGELQPISIYTDKEGKDRADLKVKGSHVSFNPFGEPKPKEETAENENSNNKPLNEQDIRDMF